MSVAKFSDGTIVRIDHVIRGDEARKHQIYPGCVQVNYSDVGQPIRNQSSKTIRADIADRWIAGEILLIKTK